MNDAQHTPISIEAGRVYYGGEPVGYFVKHLKDGYHPVALLEVNGQFRTYELDQIDIPEVKDDALELLGN